MTDPTTAPKSTQLLQKLVFGAVDGIPQAANDRSYHSPEKHIIAPKALFRGCGRDFHKQPMTDPTTAPKSTQLLQKLVFGAVDGIPQKANDRSYHSPEKHTIAPKARFRAFGRNSKSNQWQILPQPRKAHNCSKSSFSGLWTEFHKQPMTDPATAPKSKELLQKLIFGAVDGIPQAANDRSYHSPEKHIIAPKALFRGCGRDFHKQPMTDPTTAPKSTQLLQKLVFGAVDGIPQKANDRSYHSPEKHTIAPKARFRAFGRNSKSNQWQILPQPRKAHNCSKSSFSGLWTEFHKQPMTDPATAPKSKELLQKLIFGAVDGIPQAANDRSYHSPEKHTIAPKAFFRGCGRNSTSSQWQILPQPRKAHNCSKSSFSGLWTEFHKQPMTDPTTAPKSKQLLQKGLWTEFHKKPMTDPTTAPKSTPLLQKLVFGAVDEFHKQPMTDPTTAPKSTQLLQKLIFGAVDGIPQAANDRSYDSSEKHTIAPKDRFRGCGRNSTSSQWQILPQPRKAKNCFKSSFSGLWMEFHKQPMTEPTTAPKSTQLLQKLVFGAVDGIPQAANDRSCHSPENQTIAAKARFRGCGRNSTSSQWQIPPQPRKAHNCSKSSFSGLWTEFHKQPMTDPTTAPKSTQLLQKLVFGAVDGIPQAANDRSYHSPEKHTIAPKARLGAVNGRNSTSSQWHILAGKCASRHNGVRLFISRLASWLRTRRFSEPTFRPPGARIMEKTQWIATFLPFRASPSSLFLLFLFYSSPFWSFSSLCLCPALLFICPYCRKFDF